MQEFLTSASEMHWKCAYVFKLYRFWHSLLLSALFHLLRDIGRPNRSHHKQKNTVILWSGCKHPAKFLLPGPNPPLNRGEMWCKVSATPSRWYFFLPVFTVKLLCGSKQGCNPPYYTILSIHHILFFPLWKGRWGNRWKGLAIFASSTKAIVRGDWLHVCNHTLTHTHTHALNVDIKYVLLQLVTVFCITLTIYSLPLCVQARLGATPCAWGVWCV